MTVKLSPEIIQTALGGLHSDWSLNTSNDHILRIYTFENYYQTMAFANSVAWIAHQNDHHPDMTIAYKTCRVDYTTHSVKGLTHVDFVCAKAIDDLIT